MTIDISEHVDQVLARHPMPWYVGRRPSDLDNRPRARSMYPIRDGNHRVVAYAPSEQVARLIARLVKDAP